MSKICVVNVQVFGEYDIPFTVLNMIAPEGYSNASIRQAVRMVEEESKMEREVTVAFNKLKALGFTSANSFNLEVGGDL